jgi:hypothetical protein
LETNPNRAFQGVTASTLPRSNEEEVRGQYLDASRFNDEPGFESPPDESAASDRVTPHRTAYEERVTGSGRKGNEYLIRPIKEFRKKSSPETPSAPSNLLAHSSSVRGQSPLLHLVDDEEGSGDESDSDDGNPLPLFTRRDIPDVSEDPDTHELLMHLATA